MFVLPVVLLVIICLSYEVYKLKEFKRTIAVLLISIFTTVIVIGIDYSIQTHDEEVWSGKIISVEHKEEYDKEVRHETTDSKGNVTGYYYTTEHHEAENYVTTSDNGSIQVNKSQDGKTKFNDSYPNTNQELAQYWKIGYPSASVHSYTNKVQSSYSIYKHKEIDLKKYKDLPKYPKQTINYISLDRIIGDVPNKSQSLEKLAYWNTELNKSIPDAERVGKTRSWKQVNIIFVNVGDKSEDYGFALQDKWEGGNKNDFVVSFAMDSEGNIKWVYAFSWSEVELLKIEVRDYMLNQKQIKDFVPVVDTISQMVADKFVRKQFADFNYLQIDVSNGGMIIIWIFNSIIGLIFIVFIKDESNTRIRSNNRRFNRRYTYF